MNDLDSILSGSSDAEPAMEEQQEQVTQESQAEGSGQQQELQPEANEQGSQPQGQKMVPHEALHAEKQKVKRYTDEVVDLRKSNETLQRQIAEVLQRIPVPKQESPQAPDQFDDFQGAALHAVRPELSAYEARLERKSKRDAIRYYGVEAVQEAFGAVQEFSNSNTPDAKALVDYLKQQSDDPFDDIVQWHKQQKSAQLTRDPRVTKLLEHAGTNPAVLDQIEALFAPQQQQGNTQQPQAQPAAVMPSNIAGARNVGSRSGPAWSGPPTLQDIFSR